jgi:hypothetical protein
MHPLGEAELARQRLVFSLFRTVAGDAKMRVRQTHERTDRGVDALLRVQPRQSQQQQRVLRHAERSPADRRGVRHCPKSVTHKGALWRDPVLHDVIANARRDADQVIGRREVFEVVVATHPADHRAGHSSRYERRRAAHPGMHQIGAPSRCRAPDRRRSADQPRRRAERERLMRHRCFGEPGKGLPMRPTQHLLLDAALGQGGDRVEREGLGAAGRGAGDDMQDAHHATRCQRNASPARNGMTASSPSPTRSGTRHSSRRSVTRCSLAGRR